jgi:sugar/nucleoside kinase (ribokinase family)
MAGVALSSNGRRTFDVLGVGAVAVDDIVVLERYPPPDQKAAVVDTLRECGGLAGTALVAATRLGARCGYAGVLGDDELSRYALGCLVHARIDVQHVVRRKGAGPIHSIIVVDSGANTRNIFFDTRRFAGPDRRRPASSLVRDTRVVLVDHIGIDAMTRVARVARASGVHVVADFEGGIGDQGFDELFALVDHVIVSADFASELTGRLRPAAAVDALWTDARDTVVVTAGEHGSWYRDATGGVRHQPAFRVAVRDTTGCGDVFHGAYAAALARGLDTTERVELASGAAALAAETIGGQAGAPTAQMVSELLGKEVLAGW